MKIPEYYYDHTFIPFKDQLIGKRPPTHYMAGETLINVGEYMTNTYYIHQGILKLAIVANTGAEKTALFVGRGGLFPLYSPPERRYREERDELVVRAQTDVVVTKIPQQHVAELIDHEPQFARIMLRQYADFSAILLYDAINLASQDNLTKVCSYLYQYEKLLKPHGIILTQEEIASNIGIPLLTLSRHLQKLRQQGIISTARKQIHVLDWPRLIKLCSPELLTPHPN